VTCASKIIVILFSTSFWMGYIMCSLPHSNDMWRHDDAYNHIISLLGPTYLVKLKKSPSLDAWLFDDIVKVYVDCPPSLHQFRLLVLLAGGLNLILPPSQWIRLIFFLKTQAK
jgi:hypothetical protein